MTLSQLLKKYNLSPRKGLGQNFLSDPHHLQKIVDAAELSPTDTVLEVGPGPGTLTQMLCQQAGQVIAVELDPHMVNLLRTEYARLQNLTIVEADILGVDVGELLETGVRGQGAGVRSQSSEFTAQGIESGIEEKNNPKSKIQNLKSYKVVANLPYYITSAAIKCLLETNPQPKRVVVTIQKEVAQRIVAKPGNMSVLAVSVQFYGRPTLVHNIPASAFYPPPKVDSAVVRIDTYPQPPIAVTSTKQFFSVVKAGFSQKRKQLKNTLSSGLHLPMPQVIAVMQQAGIDPIRRAQTLSLEEWGRLTETLQMANSE